MIIRIWHGWTSSANADAYESLLKEEIFIGIGNRQIRGYRGIELLRRESADQVEFITLMRFDNLASVQDFAGTDYETAVVPPAARVLLSHFDARSQHYELRVA
jgi:antibiotic biosynthesis monooxygenase (ABM) superfamily enzyme